MRLVLLDKRIFKHKRLKLRLNDDYAEVVYLLDHRLDLRKMAASEIARHPVFELLCLADVYDIVLGILHNIDAGEHWQLIRFLKQSLVHCRTSY